MIKSAGLFPLHPAPSGASATECERARRRAQRAGQVKLSGAILDDADLVDRHNRDPSRVEIMARLARLALPPDQAAQPRQPHLCLAILI